MLRGCGHVCATRPARAAAAWALALATMLLSGCLTLIIPAVIAYFASSDDSDEAPETRAALAGSMRTVMHTARVEVNVSAPKAYQTVLDLAREQRLKILLKDDAVRLLQVTDGVQTASVSVLALKKDRCEIAVTASAPRDVPVAADQELALRTITRTCRRLSVTFKVEGGCAGIESGP